MELPLEVVKDEPLVQLLASCWEQMWAPWSVPPSKVGRSARMSARRTVTVWAAPSAPRWGRSSAPLLV